MAALRYTLLSDGSSDVALMPIIEWVIAQHLPSAVVTGQFAVDLGPVGLGLAQRIPVALRLFPCEMLFLHRDAEGQTLAARMREIDAAMARAAGPLPGCWVPVIPVRMTEAWLLSDPAAIRSAAGNAAGTMRLRLPAKARWERLPDPKQVLFDALTAAADQSARALAKFKPQRQRALVAQRTVDFSGLRGLRAFDLFETRLIEKLSRI